MVHTPKSLKIISSDQVDPGVILTSDIASAEFNVANKLAKLDANTLLPPTVTYPCLEEYSNHLGTVDNFTQTSVSGSGTAIEDAANHEMDLTTGTTNSSYAILQSKKSYVLSTKPIVVNFLINNLIDGDPIVYSCIGLKNDFTGIPYPFAVFFQWDTNNWSTRTGESSDTSNSISALANGDILTIVATSSIVKFFVNGLIVATHTTNLPTSALKVGAMVFLGALGSPAVGRSISIDMMRVQRYI